MCQRTLIVTDSKLAYRVTMSIVTASLEKMNINLGNKMFVGLGTLKDEYIP